MKKIFFILLLFITINVYAETSLDIAKFSKCVDGDTAYFFINGKEEKFRFLAIDTPETTHPTKNEEAYGKTASEYTCDKLTNAENIIVEYESSNTTDKYQRKLAWIWVDENLLQKDLVEQGYAEVAYIYGNYKYTDSLCLFQQKAIEDKLGIWSTSRKEGYCSTIDTSNVVNNIKYKNIQEDIENNKKVDEVLDKISNTQNNIDNSFKKNSKVFTYIFIGAAFIVMLIQEIKKER